MRTDRPRNPWPAPTRNMTGTMLCSGVKNLYSPQCRSFTAQAAPSTARNFHVVLGRALAARKRKADRALILRRNERFPRRRESGSSDVRRRRQLDDDGASACSEEQAAKGRSAAGVDLVASLRRARPRTPDAVCEVSGCMGEGVGLGLIVPCSDDLFVFVRRF
jgi:hypothetical protein